MKVAMAWHVNGVMHLCEVEVGDMQFGILDGQPILTLVDRYCRVYIDLNIRSANFDNRGFVEELKA